jgi:hypothetical protein
MEVKNISGTSGRKCDCCDSWKGHWEKITNEKARACSRKGCSNRATVGAHVMRTADSTWRIVPLCHECNKRRDWMELNRGTQTVSAAHFSCE